MVLNSPTKQGMRNGNKLFFFWLKPYCGHPSVFPHELNFGFQHRKKKKLVVLEKILIKKKL